MFQNDTQATTFSFTSLTSCYNISSPLKEIMLVLLYHSASFCMDNALHCCYMAIWWVTVTQVGWASCQSVTVYHQFVCYADVCSVWKKKKKKEKNFKCEDNLENDQSRSLIPYIYTHIMSQFGWKRLTCNSWHVYLICFVQRWGHPSSLSLLLPSTSAIKVNFSTPAGVQMLCLWSKTSLPLTLPRHGNYSLLSSGFSNESPTCHGQEGGYSRVNGRPANCCDTDEKHICWHINPEP